MSHENWLLNEKQYFITSHNYEIYSELHQTTFWLLKMSVEKWYHMTTGLGCPRFTFIHWLVVLVIGWGTDQGQWLKWHPLPTVSLPYASLTQCSSVSKNKSKFECCITSLFHYLQSKQQL